MKTNPLFIFGRFNTVKMAIIPTQIYKFSAIIPIVKTDKLILKFIWKLNKPRRAKTTLKKSNRTERLTLPDFKMYFDRVPLTYKDRHIIKGTEMGVQKQACTFMAN